MTARAGVGDPGGPVFREVYDGNALPPAVYDANGQVDPVRLIEWYCPGIGSERAVRIAAAGARERAPISVASLRSLVLRHWDAPPGPGVVTIAGRSLSCVEASCIRPGVYKVGGRVTREHGEALRKIMMRRASSGSFEVTIGTETFEAFFCSAELDPARIPGSVAYELTAEIGRVARPRQVEAVLGAIKAWRDDYRREAAARFSALPAPGPAVVLHELQGLPIETPPAHLALLTERAAPPERDRTAAEYFAGKGERYSPAGGWER